MAFNQISFKTKTEIAAFGMIFLGVFTLATTYVGQILLLLGGTAWRWGTVLYPAFGVLMFYFFSRLLRHSFAGWCFTVVFMLLVIVSFFMNYVEIDIKSPINWLYCFWPLAEFIILLLILSDRKRHFADLKKTTAIQCGSGGFLGEIKTTKKMWFAAAVAIIMFVFVATNFVGVSVYISECYLNGRYCFINGIIKCLILAGYGLNVFLIFVRKKIGLYLGLLIFGLGIFIIFGALPHSDLRGGIILLPVLFIHVVAFLFLLFDVLNDRFYCRKVKCNEDI